MRAANANFFPKAADERPRADTGILPRLVEVGQVQGDIASDIDPQVAAVVIRRLSYLHQPLSAGQDCCGEIVLKLDGANLFDLPEVKAIFNAASELVEYGMRGNGQRRRNDESHGVVREEMRSIDG